MKRLETWIFEKLGAGATVRQLVLELVYHKRKAVGVLFYDEKYLGKNSFGGALPYQLGFGNEWLFLPRFYLNLHFKNRATMFKQLFFLTIFVAFLSACGSEQPADTTAQTGQSQIFGDTITTDGAVTMGEMVTKLQGVDSLPVKIKGTVESVCQVKGCWVNLRDEQAGDMFVKFKDYGFFLPKDIAGREVVMEGYAFRETTSVEDLKHYAEDEGKTQAEIDAITEPKEELKFLANGVVLLPDTKK